MTQSLKFSEIVTLIESRVFEAALLNEAIRQYEPNVQAELIRLLNSDDPEIVEDGLYIFGALPDVDEVVLASALTLLERGNVQWDLYIVSGVLSYPHKLSPQHLGKCLKIADYPDDRIKINIALLLHLAGVKRVAAAIDVGIGETNDAVHRVGYQFLSGEKSLKEVMGALTEGGIISCYAGGFLIGCQLKLEEELALAALGNSSLVNSLLDLRRARRKYPKVYNVHDD